MGPVNGVPGFISECLLGVCGDRALGSPLFIGAERAAQGRVSATETGAAASWAEPSGPAGRGGPAGLTQS